MPPWEADYDVYMMWLDDAPASVLVDLAAIQHVPLITHGARVQLRVAMQKPTDEGLRSDEEFGPLGDLEEQLFEWLERCVGAVPVGHLIHDGFLHLIAYAPSDRIGDPEALLDGFDAGTYELAWFVEDDSGWGMYLEFLYPDMFALQVILNRRQLRVRTEHGDDLEQTRIVDHVAYFATRMQGEQAATALREAGFTTDPITQGEDDDSNLWLLEFHREERLDDDQPDRFCHEVLELLAPHDAHYDGWGAPIVGAKSGGESGGESGA